MDSFDIIIIGGGIIGCSIARELSKYHLDIAVFEKDIDIVNGSTKANSAIVHGGYDADSSKLKGYFSRRGNELFDTLDRELNFGFSRIGSLVLAFKEEDLSTLYKLKENGEKNGVKDLQILDRDEILSIEPGVSSSVLYALFCPSAGITSPYGMGIALMENAVKNGVKLFLDEEVTSITKCLDRELFKITTNKGEYYSKKIINAAGVYSDHISKMVGVEDFYIIPRKGEYLILSRETGALANTVLFQCPSDLGKGVLITTTIYNNLLIGPNANEVLEKEDLSTSADSIKEIIKKARLTMPNIPINKFIRSFAGLRATSNKRDFIIEETRIKGFINVAGIESPGLTSAPAIALYISDLIFKDTFTKNLKNDFDPYRMPIETALNKENTLNFKEVDALSKLSKGDPNRIVCRCEQVREGVILDALSRGIEVLSTDGIKRRTRAGMGACQGSYCHSHVKDLISECYNIDKILVSRGSNPSKRVKRNDILD